MSLQGQDREGIEQTGKDRCEIMALRDAYLDVRAGMLEQCRVRPCTLQVVVNNHFESCAPLTMERLRKRVARRTLLRSG